MAFRIQVSTGKASVRWNPYSAMQLASLIHENGQHVEISYEETGALITAELDQTSLNRIVKAGGSALAYEILKAEEQNG